MPRLVARLAAGDSNLCGSNAYTAVVLEKFARMRESSDFDRRIGVLEAPLQPTVELDRDALRHPGGGKVSSDSVGFAVAEHGT